MCQVTCRTHLMKKQEHIILLLITFFFLFCLFVLQISPKALHRLNMCSITELHPAAPISLLLNCHSIFGNMKVYRQINGYRKWAGWYYYCPCFTSVIYVEIAILFLVYHHTDFTSTVYC